MIEPAHLSTKTGTAGQNTAAQQAFAAVDGRWHHEPSRLKRGVRLAMVIV